MDRRIMLLLRAYTTHQFNVAKPVEDRKIIIRHPRTHFEFINYYVFQLLQVDSGFR